MAGIGFKKLKSSGEVKAVLRHCDTEQRAKTKEHSNKDINPALTSMNFEILDRSYEECCQMYDKAMEQAEKNSKRKIRVDAVRGVTNVYNCPKGLPKEQFKEWCQKVYNIVSDYVGEENMIQGYGHVDEVHDYYDPQTKEKTTSEEHLHIVFVPITKDGQLNCKGITNDNYFYGLNDAIEEMTMRDYGLHYNLNSKENKERRRRKQKGNSKEERYPKWRTVEQLKVESAVYAREEEQRAKEHRHVLIEKNNELLKINNKLQEDNENLTDQIQKNTETLNQQEILRSIKDIEDADRHEQAEKFRRKYAKMYADAQQSYTANQLSTEGTYGFSK